MRKLLLPAAVLGSLVACSEVEIAPAPAPEALACAVVADEAIEGPLSGGKIAVAGDGSVFVVWDDQGFRAARRSPGGGWERIDGAAAGAPVGQLSLTGTPGGAAALLIGDYEPAALWRFSDGAWDLALETMSDEASNQSHDNLTTAPDGSLHFALRVEREDDTHLELLALAPSAEAPLSLAELDDGRDPMLAVDARGARHVVYEPHGDEQTLAYLAPDGARRAIPLERQGWPSFVADGDALFVFSAGHTSFVNEEELTTPPLILASGDGKTWDRFAALERIDDACPDLGPWAHERIGEVCQHHVHRDDGHVLLGGPRALLLLRERRELGTKIWGCSQEGEQMCSWNRGDDYTQTHSVLIGRVSRGGTALAPLPMELEGFGDYRALIDAAQDASGRVHLLVGEPSSDEVRHRYVQLTCDEVAP
jgi:hypothetical protein